MKRKWAKTLPGHGSRMRRAAAILLLQGISAVLLSCSTQTTNPLLYVMNPLLVEGNKRPAPPTDLQYSYDAALQTLRLTWAPSIDPDTMAETPIYRVYMYLVYPPPSFFRPEDRIDEPIVREEFVETKKYTGLLYFIVTGYDGFAESLPSSPLTARVP